MRKSAKLTQIAGKQESLFHRGQRRQNKFGEEIKQERKRDARCPRRRRAERRS